MVNSSYAKEEDFIKVVLTSSVLSLFMESQCLGKTMNSAGNPLSLSLFKI